VKLNQVALFSFVSLDMSTDAGGVSFLSLLDRTQSRPGLQVMDFPQSMLP